MSTPVVTIAFALHRPEMVPLMAEYMQEHEALFLEEPPTVDFERMLAGLITVDEYLMTDDSEYPLFTKLMCAALRDLTSKGKKIFQVEPYLENLLALHDFFADGGRPLDLRKNTLMYMVYLYERNATGALLTYYQAAAGRPFEKTVEAVKRFARADAARFRLRDELRARALSARIGDFASSFIEAGMMHYLLKRLVARQVSRHTMVQSVFPATEIGRDLGQRGHLYGPGDQLTLLYILHPEITATDRETLLAARALIYTKIITKEELGTDATAYPHLQDELTCIKVTRGLSIKDCRRLFALIRGVDTFDARRIVADDIAKTSPPLARSLISGRYRHTAAMGTISP